MSDEMPEWTQEPWPEPDIPTPPPQSTPKKDKADRLGGMIEETHGGVMALQSLLHPSDVPEGQESPVEQILNLLTDVVKGVRGLHEEVASMNERIQALEKSIARR